MNLLDKVLYFNKPVYVVGIRYPRMDEHGCHLDLSRKEGSAKADYRDVPEKHVRMVK